MRFKFDSSKNHSFNIPPLNDCYKNNEINAGNIEIINLKYVDMDAALTSRAIEDMEYELQKRISLKPVSKFVRLVLKEKITQKPALTELKNQILNRCLEHKDVKERNSTPSPLSIYEQKHFKSLVERIIGGCMVQAPYLPTIKKAEELTTIIFSIPELSHLRIGTIACFLINSCRSFLDIARLSSNTLRKVMKKLAPESATRRGRSNPSDMQLLKDFIFTQFNERPIGI